MRPSQRRMNLRKLAGILLALIVLGAFVLLAYECLANRELRRQLTAAKDRVRKLESSETPQKVSRSTVTAPATRLAQSEIESKLLDLIRTGQWRKDRQAQSKIFSMIDSKDMAYAFEIVDRNAMGPTRRLVRTDLLTSLPKANPVAAP